MTRGPFDRETALRNPEQTVDQLETASWFITCLARAVAAFEVEPPKNQSFPTLKALIEYSVRNGSRGIQRQSPAPRSKRVAHLHDSLYEDFLQQIEYFHSLS